jgi:hypothetical protein
LYGSRYQLVVVLQGAMLKRESRQRLFTITCHVPRLIRPASVTSQSTRALTCVRLCCFPRRATFPRLPFSFLEDVLHFPTFCSQPTIHSCPSTSDVSIHSLGKATVKLNMWKCTNQTLSTRMNYFLLEKMPLETLLCADSLCPTLASPRSWRLCS